MAGFGVQICHTGLLFYFWGWRAILFHIDSSDRCRGAVEVPVFTVLGVPSFTGLRYSSTAELIYKPFSAHNRNKLCNFEQDGCSRCCQQPIPPKRRWGHKNKRQPERGSRGSQSNRVSTDSVITWIKYAPRHGRSRQLPKIEPPHLTRRLFHWGPMMLALHQRTCPSC